ncbi:hypothetical protein GOP47_0005694, partial [Adiantum capillus-veneris]
MCFSFFVFGVTLAMALFLQLCNAFWRALGHLSKYGSLHLREGTLPQSPTSFQVDRILTTNGQRTSCIVFSSTSSRSPQSQKIKKSSGMYHIHKLRSLED